MYAYDGWGRMISSANATYAYRPDGLRYSKTAGETTRHVWSGSNIVADLSNSRVAPLTRYIRGINLIRIEDGYHPMRYYLHNAHGDVVQLADEFGGVCSEYDYDAFGVARNADGWVTYAQAEGSPVSDEQLADEQNMIMRVADGWDGNPFRYCGEYWDKETNTYFLRARYYNPIIGRFTQQDNWEYADPNDPLSLNLYTYCINNPIYYQDSSGNVMQATQDGGGKYWGPTWDTDVPNYTGNSFTRFIESVVIEAGELYVKAGKTIWAIPKSSSVYFGGGAGVGGSISIYGVELSALAKFIEYGGKFSPVEGFDHGWMSGTEVGMDAFSVFQFDAGWECITLRVNRIIIQKFVNTNIAA